MEWDEMKSALSDAEKDVAPSRLQNITASPYETEEKLYDEYDKNYNNFFDDDEYLEEGIEDAERTDEIYDETYQTDNNRINSCLTFNKKSYSLTSLNNTHTPFEDIFSKKIRLSQTEPLCDILFDHQNIFQKPLEALAELVDTEMNKESLTNFISIAQDICSLAKSKKALKPQDKNMIIRRVRDLLCRESLLYFIFAENDHIDDVCRKYHAFCAENKLDDAECKKGDKIFDFCRMLLDFKKQEFSTLSGLAETYHSISATNPQIYTTRNYDLLLHAGAEIALMKLASFLDEGLTSADLCIKHFLRNSDKTQHTGGGFIAWMLDVSDVDEIKQTHPEHRTLIDNMELSLDASIQDALHTPECYHAL